MGKGGSKLSNSELQELEDTTYFDKKELQQWYKEFLKDCPEGNLKKKDFQTIYKQFFPTGDSSQFANFVFNVFDSDKDGHISFHEFMKALSVTSRGSLDEKLNWAFSLYDQDNDGYISKCEMINIVGAIYAMVGRAAVVSEEDTPESRVTKIFHSMDSDNDGKLSKEEFREGSKSDPWIVQALTLESAPNSENH